MTNIYKTELFPHIVGDSLVGKTVTLTIKAFTQDDLSAGNGRTERKYLLMFEETPKTLILNKTNAKTIAKLYGGETGDWKGKRITLFSEQVRAFGANHNAIRVAPAVPDEKATVDTGDIDDTPPAQPEQPEPEEIAF